MLLTDDFFGDNFEAKQFLQIELNGGHDEYTLCGCKSCRYSMSAGLWSTVNTRAAALKLDARLYSCYLNLLNERGSGISPVNGFFSAFTGGGKKMNSRSRG